MIDPHTIKKTCRVCEKKADRDEFVYDSQAFDQRKNICKPCHAQRERERRAANAVRKRGRPKKPTYNTNLPIKTVTRY